MINVGATELRLKLTYYLDMLEKGEEVAIIRHSAIIGHIKPVTELKVGVAEKQISTIFILPDGSQIKFRQPGIYESSEAIVNLFPEAARAEKDLSYGPVNYYQSNFGEFWVGESAGKVVAAGGFLKNFLKGGKLEVRRLEVVEDLRGQGIEDYLAKLLEARIDTQVK